MERDLSTPSTAEAKNVPKPKKKLIKPSQKKAPSKPSSAAKKAPVKAAPTLQLATRRPLTSNQAACQRQRTAVYLAKSAIMLRQRTAGASIVTLAKRHKVTRQTVYARLRSAQRLKAPDPAPKAKKPTIVRKPSPLDERKRMVYLEARINRLETVLTQFIKLGATKIIRALSP